MKKYLEWSVRATEDDERIVIKKNTVVTTERLKEEKYDVILVAIGAKPILPQDFIVENKTFWVGDVETEKVQTGKEVVIVGGGLTGCECA